MLKGQHDGRWILAADVEAGLEMFLELQPPLAPSTVLPLLAGQVREDTQLHMIGYH